MSTVLIDNATLTAVQRLTGTAPTRSSDSTDGDILALENLVTGIFFYDQILALDDYKPEFRHSRKAAFPFVRFISEDFPGLETIRGVAEQEASAIHPRIEGGEFADETFAQFMRQLKMHMICTWDISGSVYYLTLKMLGESRGEEFDRYGKLAATIFSELTEARNSGGRAREDASLLDSRGCPIDSEYRIAAAKWGDGVTGGMTSGLKAFIASINWLAVRTLYYTHAARYMGAASFLYPIRQGFQLNYLDRYAAIDRGIIPNLVDRLRRDAQDELDFMVSDNCSVATRLDIPVMSAWLVRETRDVTRVVEKALSIRNEEEFVTAREQLGELREVIVEKGQVAAKARCRKIRNGLHDTLQRLRRKYGIRTSQGVPVVPIIHTYNALAATGSLPKLPALALPIKYPDVVDQWLTRAGFASVFRNMVEDLTSVERLGELRVMLGASIRKEDGLTFKPKAESPRYRHVHSQWKSPM